MTLTFGNEHEQEEQETVEHLGRGRGQHGDHELVDGRAQQVERRRASDVRPFLGDQTTSGRVTADKLAEWVAENVADRLRTLLHFAQRQFFPKQSPSRLEAIVEQQGNGLQENLVID